MTRKKLPTGKELGDLINAEHFGKPKKPGSTDPITPIQMVLEVTEIERYKHNPRISNPQFDAIKGSIRTRGFEGTLQVTKEPADEKYTLRFGQGSSLAALLELFKETGDEQFRWVNCRYLPFTADSDIIIGHLVENESRADLTLLEKAMGLRDFQLALAQETGQRLSLGRLVTAAQKKAYEHIDKSTLGRLYYALDRLYPHIPKALDNGMGMPQVRTLRALEKAGKRLWRSYGLEAGDFSAVYTGCLAGADGPDWAIDKARRAFEAMVAQRTGKSISEVGFDLDLLLAGASLAEITIRGAVDSPGSEKDSLPTDLPLGNMNDMEKAAANRESASAGTTRPAPRLKLVKDRPRADGIPNDRLMDLREKAFMLASCLAEHNLLDDVLIPSPVGFGYLILDVPDPSIEQQTDAASYEKICCLWWELTACCEVMLAPDPIITDFLPEGSTLTEAITGKDFSTLVTRVLACNPGEVGFRLRSRLDDEDWDNLIRLMQTHRKIRSVSDQRKQELW